MTVRDMKKAEMVKERIVRENPDADIKLFEIDLSSLSSVTRFCSQFLSQDIPLNILMYVRFTLIVTSCIHARTYIKEKHEICRNNAGVFSPNLEFSEDKIELTFATNFLGNFVKLCDTWIYVYTTMSSERELMMLSITFQDITY